MCDRVWFEGELEEVQGGVHKWKLGECHTGEVEEYRYLEKLWSQEHGR